MRICDQSDTCIQDLAFTKHVLTKLSEDEIEQATELAECFAMAVPPEMRSVIVLSAAYFLLSFTAAAMLTLINDKPKNTS